MDSVNGIYLYPRSRLLFRSDPVTLETDTRGPQLRCIRRPQPEYAGMKRRTESQRMRLLRGGSHRGLLRTVCFALPPF
jgi:hypothetical protein